MREQARENWTNPSVIALARGADPVEVITKKAQEIVISAMDAGWSGPPFDMLELADFLKVSFLPSTDVRDARIVPSGRASFVIEFNPNRPRGRVRYSIAHEIAHTIFPDCAERIRNRALHEEMRGDEWQLELLCNIAAAEFLMPLGSLESISEEDLDINRLLDIRKRYDVSMEALLLRVARVTDRALAVFAASRSQGSDRYRLDYITGSRSWGVRLRRGLLVPPGSAVTDCIAIGYTAKGDEKWGSYSSRLHVECVGIPPFPGSRYPRVVGTIRPEKGSEEEGRRIVFLRGSALEPRGSGKKIVAHVVNDKTPNWGGAGFASRLKSKWPEAQDDFRSWVADNPSLLSLGGTRLVEVARDIVVASMICQKGYGPSVKPRVRYSAMKECLSTLASEAKAMNASVHMPRVGCGQAGGSWSVIQELIELTLVTSGVEVTVYDLPDALAPVPTAQALLDLG